MRTSGALISQKDIAAIRKEAERFVESDQTLRQIAAGILGSVLNGNGRGRENVREIIDRLFGDLQKRLDALPDEFSNSGAPEIYGQVCSAEVAALFYIHIERLRPTPKFSFSSAKRLEDKSCQAELDNQLQFAAASFISMRNLKHSLEKYRDGRL